MRDCMGKCGDFCEILPLPKASPIYGRLRKRRASYYINLVFVNYGDEHDGFSFFPRGAAGCPR